MNFAIENRFATGIIKLSKLSVPKLIIYSFILNSVILLSFSVFSDKPETPQLQFDSLREAIFVVVIVGPLAETAIFQYLIIEYTKKYLNSFLLAFLISAAAFGASHYYSVNYMIATFLSGLILAGLYIILKAKNSHAFPIVYLIHAAYNLMTLILNSIFQNHS